MKVKKETGQSLVELALLLPAFCFSVFAIVQLIVFCRNQLELQRMAQVAADGVTITTQPGSVFYSRFNSLWGRITPPRINRSWPQKFATWRAYRGLWTVSGENHEGHYMPLEVATYLLPGEGYTQLLGITTQKATSVAFIEPATPEDPS